MRAPEKARPVAVLASILALAASTTGCTTTAGWTAGATRATDQTFPARKAADVAVSYKESFGLFERTSERLPRACYSTTLLRRMELLPGSPAKPSGDAVAIAELTTEEFPRDEDKSRIEGPDFTRVFGIGTDETDLFRTLPSKWAVEHGVARLREMAAALGADEVRDIYCTGYAEHQMWEGAAISFMPASPSSPIYVSGTLLTFRLRDVRFHGTAVRRKGGAS